MVRVTLSPARHSREGHVTPFCPLGDDMHDEIFTIFAEHLRAEPRPRLLGPGRGSGKNVTMIETAIKRTKQANKQTTNNWSCALSDSFWASDL